MVSGQFYPIPVEISKTERTRMAAHAVFDLILLRLSSWGRLGVLVDGQQSDLPSITITNING